jgi:hypothetical protein
VYNCSLNCPGKLTQEDTLRDVIAGSQTARKNIVNAFRLDLLAHLTAIAANAKMMNNPDKNQRP